MASSSKKKVDLRDLMKKQRSETKTSAKRIDSPLAKYNNIGQLVCVVCNCQVKSEIVWPAHVQGKKHRENVAALRSRNTAAAAPPVPRQAPSQPIHTGQAGVKRRPDPDVTSTTATAEKKPRTSDPVDGAKGLPAGFFDSDIQSPPSLAERKPASSASAEESNNVSSSLPADFFDAGAKVTVPPEEDTLDSRISSTEDKTKERKPSTAAEAIPEGFFDDPVMDAKVRHVEVKNTMEEEWSKFQKEMVEENQVSENIKVEDEEAAQVDRNIDEIDEQIHCFSKVEALRDKQDDIKSQMQSRKLQQDTAAAADRGEADRDSGGSADEAEFEEFLDWRSKGAWK